MFENVDNTKFEIDRSYRLISEMKKHSVVLCRCRLLNIGIETSIYYAKKVDDTILINFKIRPPVTPDSIEHNWDKLIKTISKSLKGFSNKSKNKFKNEILETKNRTIDGIRLKIGARETYDIDVIFSFKENGPVDTMMFDIFDYEKPVYVYTWDYTTGCPVWTEKRGLFDIKNEPYKFHIQDEYGIMVIKDLHTIKHRIIPENSGKYFECKYLPLEHHYKCVDCGKVYIEQISNDLIHKRCGECRTIKRIKDNTYTTKICKRCGKSFEISEGEMEFFVSRNLYIPCTCKECRNERKQQE